MKDGFVRCASATVDIKVADTDYNTSNIIKAIEDAAQNNIKHITVDDGVTSLGSSIFYGFSQVKDVKLPTSLKSIGYGAFEKCDSLKELTIP